jgi:hypothetical protein
MFHYKNICNDLQKKYFESRRYVKELEEKISYLYFIFNKREQKNSKNILGNHVIKKNTFQNNEKSPFESFKYIRNSKNVNNTNDTKIIKNNYKISPKKDSIFNRIKHKELINLKSPHNNSKENHTINITPQKNEFITTPRPKILIRKRNDEFLFSPRH